MADFKKDPDEIGVLWAKEGRRGPYMTGTINGVGVVVFATNAKSDKAPTWRVLKAKPRDDADQRRNDSTPLDDF
jgi:hypothetical protein